MISAVNICGAMRPLLTADPKKRDLSSSQTDRQTDRRIHPICGLSTLQISRGESAVHGVEANDLPSGGGVSELTRLSSKGYTGLFDLFVKGGFNYHTVS